MINVNLLDEDVDDSVLASHTRAPERGHIVNRPESNMLWSALSSLEAVPVVLNLVQAPLFKVCIAEAHKILHDLNVAALARDEEGRATLPDN